MTDWVDLPSVNSEQCVCVCARAEITAPDVLFRASGAVISCGDPEGIVF